MTNAWITTCNTSILLADWSPSTSPSGPATYSALITQPIPRTLEISMWQLHNNSFNCNSLKKQVVYRVALPHRFPHTMGWARLCHSKASVKKKKFSLMYSKLITLKVSAKEPLLIETVPTSVTQHGNTRCSSAHSASLHSRPKTLLQWHRLLLPCQARHLSSCQQIISQRDFPRAAGQGSSVFRKHSCPQQLSMQPAQLDLIYTPSLPTPQQDFHPAMHISPVLRGISETSKADIPNPHKYSKKHWVSHGVACLGSGSLHM